MEHSKSDITLVRVAWLQRLPDKVTLILAIFVDTATLDQLAKTADAIIKLSPTGFNRVDPKPVDTVVSSSMNAIYARISHLERLPSVTPSQSRSHSKPRTKRTENLWWYHHENGSSVRKCKPWCTFNGTTRGQLAAQRAHVRHADAVTQREVHFASCTSSTNTLNDAPMVNTIHAHPRKRWRSYNHRNSEQNSIASPPTIKHDVFQSNSSRVARRPKSTQTTPLRNNHDRLPLTAHCSPSTRARSTQTSPLFGTYTTLTTVFESCFRTPVTQSTPRSKDNRHVHFPNVFLGHKVDSHTNMKILPIILAVSHSIDISFICIHGNLKLDLGSSIVYVTNYLVHINLSFCLRPKNTRFKYVLNIENSNCLQSDIYGTNRWVLSRFTFVSISSQVLFFFTIEYLFQTLLVSFNSPLDLSQGTERYIFEPIPLIIAIRMLNNVWMILSNCCMQVSRASHPIYNSGRGIGLHLLLH